MNDNELKNISECSLILIIIIIIIIFISSIKTIGPVFSLFWSFVF